MTSDRPPQPLTLITGWDEILGVWPLARQILAPSWAEPGAGDNDRTVLAALIAGHFQLWLEGGGRAAGITQIVPYEAGRQCNLAYVGATGRIDEPAALRQLELWAISQGCTGFFISSARKGFGRAPGWKEALAKYHRKECYYRNLGE